MQHNLTQVRHLPIYGISPHADRHHRPVCHIWLYKTCVTKIVHNLALLGLTLGQSSTKGEMTCYPPRSTILPISLPCVNTCQRYLLQKYLQTNKKTKYTVNNMSPACLSACGDNYTYPDSGALELYTTMHYINPHFTFTFIYIYSMVTLLLVCHSAALQLENETST